MRHFALRPLLAAAVLTAAAAAQMQEPPSHVEPVNLQSGLHDNPSPVEGLVWSDFVILPQGTPWLRLRFLGAHLGKGSWLRITSVLDGAFMTMREEHLAQWGNTSAYFNGNAVMIELFAGANTVGNHVDVLQAIAGDVDPSVLEPDTICGQTDDRVPSSDPRVGRLSMGCTGWLINVPAAGTNKLHLAAGHCVASNPVLSFAVPSSGANCALAYPPPSKQFAIDTTTMQSSNGGVGNDWWVYRCFPNSTTGRTSFEEQGAAFTLAAALPATGTTLRNYGYGLDGTNVNNATGANGSCSCSSAAGTGTRNQTQQMHTGLLNAISGTSLRYDFDTCGGNSGSVVLHGTTDQVLGIHTHGGCSTTAGTNNIGTAITLPALQTAIAAVAPPAVANDVCAAPTQLALGTNGPFDSVAATSDALAWPCGGTGPGKDLWFRFTSACGGMHTISTCTPARSFDTVLQVFSGSCGALTSLGCNDDAGGACGTGSTLAVNLPAGSYLLRVGGFAAASGTFELVVTRPEIHDAGPLVTHPTGGAGGAPASLVETAAPVAHAILGYAASSPSGVADDFVTNGPWCLQGLEIPVYQLGAAAPTITGVFVEVYGGDPRLGAPPVAGSPGIANNLLTTAGHRVAVRMSGALRALDTTPLDATRRLQSVHVDFAAPMYLNSTVLPGSRYYVQARFTGSAAGSVFVPPITAIGLAATGDGLQWNGAAWSSLLDNGAGQGVPIQLFGTSLAPAAEIADLGGGCAASTLAVTGALHAGGFVHARLQNTTLTALPAILLGLSDPAIAYAPACGCVQHAAIDVLHLGASYTIQAPATTAALGFQVYLQGAELAPAAQPCNLGLGFLFGLSNGVRVRLH